MRLSVPSATNAVKFESTGLTFSTKLTRYDMWEDILSWLDVVGRAHAWWIADAINWGSETFGEKAPQGFSRLGFAEQTLMNWAWVGRAIPRERRRPELEFGHHALVAALPEEKQSAWLDRAAKGDTMPNGETRRWSVSRLRQGLKGQKGDAVATPLDALATCQEELAKLREFYAAWLDWKTTGNPDRLDRAVEAFS